MTSRPRLPETLSIRELAQQMEKQGKIRSTTSSSNTVDRRALLAAHSLAVRSPDNRAAALEAGQDVDGWMTLRCTEIDCYDRNPRMRTNPRYAEIRASIEARGGLGEALSVTRRPGASRYMCYMGGNTRLRIVQELWHETSDPRYEWIRVVVHPWVSESDVIAAHLIENELRADTTFWEKARGVALLKAELETDLGRALSLRALSEHASKCGLKLHAVTASNYLFAIEHLDPLGPRLTHESSSAIRSRHGHLEKLAEALNLDPYPRMTAFQQLMVDMAAELNGTREQADPPRLTVAEVERILARMNAQFARAAGCALPAVERALRAVMGAEKQLPAAKIRACLSDSGPAKAPADPAPAGAGETPGDADPVIEECAKATSLQPEPRPGRTAGTAAGQGEFLDPSAFAMALNGFTAPFRIDACVRWEGGKARGFSLAPLTDEEVTSGDSDREARQAAYRLLACLSGERDRAQGADADTRKLFALLLEPAFWPLTRTLIDSYHRQFRAGAGAE